MSGRGEMSRIDSPHLIAGNGDFYNFASSWLGRKRTWYFRRNTIRVYHNPICNLSPTSHRYYGGKNERKLPERLFSSDRNIRQLFHDVFNVDIITLIDVIIPRAVAHDVTAQETLIYERAYPNGHYSYIAVARIPSTEAGPIKGQGDLLMITVNLVRKRCRLVETGNRSSKSLMV